MRKKNMSNEEFDTESMVKRTSRLLARVKERLSR
jgi:hypothetical protein